MAMSSLPSEIAAETAIGAVQVAAFGDAENQEHCRLLPKVADLVNHAVVLDQLDPVQLGGPMVDEITVPLQVRQFPKGQSDVFAAQILVLR